LATARVFLAISALVAIWMDPGEIGYSRWVYWLVMVYVAHGVVVMMLLRWRRESTPAFRLLVHSADIVWPALISLFAAAQHGPFFLFFVFVMAAAAYRWGLWETLGTATAAVLLLWFESLLVKTGFPAWMGSFVARRGLPHLEFATADLEPKRLFMSSVYLLVMGLLLGYLAEQQKRLRSEKAVIASILGGARVDAGLTGTLQEILSQLLTLYGADRVMAASQETRSYHVFLGEVRAAQNGPSLLRWIECPPAARDVYLFKGLADACFAVRREESFELVTMNREGARLRVDPSDSLKRLMVLQDFQSLATVSFEFGREWSGRLFLFDPRLSGDLEEELRFLQELIRQVGPAVYNVYLIRRLRQRAGAIERARFARELHDGAVQSLIAMEMQVDVLRRQSSAAAPAIEQELSRIQSLLREEVLKLRELMQQMKSLGVDSEHLLSFLLDTVERFQRETGITARFVSELDNVELPQKLCREVARIVQEGLVNVRKHSGAKQVLVRLATDDKQLVLTMEDDGRGFPFTGRLLQAELDAQGKGPLVIKERVRLMDGNLTIESSPGQGSRLEIRIPQVRVVSNG
jgi:signal transduction histidine kinase